MKHVSNVPMEMLWTFLENTIHISLSWLIVIYNPFIECLNTISIPRLKSLEITVIELWLKGFKLVFSQVEIFKYTEPTIGFIFKSIPIKFGLSKHTSWGKTTRVHCNLDSPQ